MSDAFLVKGVVRCDQDGFSAEQRIPVKGYLLAVLADVVAPADATVTPVKSVELPRAGPDKERLLRDRGRRVDSATRIDLPQDGCIRRVLC